MGSQFLREESTINSIILHFKSVKVPSVGIFVAFVVAFLLHATVSATVSNTVLSSIINAYLNWRFPIKSTNGQEDLPTLAYVFPNGQGNSEKLAESAKGQRTLEKTYGKIVLTRPHQVQAVFKDSNLHLKGENFNQGWLCGQILGNCLGILNLENWTRVRSICVDIFQHNKAPTHIPFIQQRIDKQFQILQSTKQIQNKKMTLQPSEDLKLLSFQIFCDIIYHDLTSTMETELLSLLKLRESIWVEVTKGGICRFSFSQILPTPTNRLLRTFKSKWEDFNDRAYKRAKNIGLGPETPIILLYTALDEGRMKKIEVLHTLDELLFENLDVSLGALAWNVIFLAAHPETQAEVRKEIAQAKEKDGEEAWVSYLLSNSTLIQACILESARLKPIVLFTTVQAIPSPRVVDDFVIPAGTHFVVDTHALNVSDPYWGDESTKYKPGRWLQSRSLTSERVEAEAVV
ncbi:hypothetical protein G7Y89_g9513 [Cudoniella acicularis]|uniref:Cytochrome P450 n=1 Tax=Cudoniella acicularis TaxID=354080 RepID=A0A8H4REI2_9HELO|nr:hypothetical protein G7Y89_g9513 [Cudoniella acicularis]